MKTVFIITRIYCLQEEIFSVHETRESANHKMEILEKEYKAAINKGMIYFTCKEHKIE